MGDNKFWLTLWCSIIAGIVIMACSGMHYSTNIVLTQSEIIAKAVDPIAVSCAMRLDDSDSYKGAKALLCVDKARK